MVEIKAGVELDRSVAEAIGLKAVAKVLGGGYFFVHPGDGTDAIPTEFAPSTDLNAAFFAAEALGLFGENRCYLGPCPAVKGLWGVYEEDMSTLRGCLGTGVSPALAICAAILELAKKPEVPFKNS